jgi:hypothetical protein
MRVGKKSYSFYQFKSKEMDWELRNEEKNIARANEIAKAKYEQSKIDKEIK